MLLSSSQQNCGWKFDERQREPQKLFACRPCCSPGCWSHCPWYHCRRSTMMMVLQSGVEIRCQSLRQTWWNRVTKIFCG